MQCDGDSDDWWLESAPKSNLFSDEPEIGSRKGGLGASLDSTSQLSRQLKGFHLSSEEDETAGFSGTTGEPVVPLNKIVSEATIDQILRWERPEITISESSEEKLLEEMLLGHQISLQSCRSIKAKANLMQGAVDSADGEVILKVVLHLMSTLSRCHFFKLIREHPIALKVYANHLSSTHQQQELTELLEALGKMRHASMFHYYVTSTKASSAVRQAQAISSISSSHFNNDKYDKFLKQHMKLLDLAASLNLTGSASGHEWLQAAAATSPVESLAPISASLCVSDRIYQFACMKALIAARRFPELHKIFATKTWLGADRIKMLVPIEKLIGELEKAKAPKGEIEKYVRMVEEPILRRNLEARVSNLYF